MIDYGIEFFSGGFQLAIELMIVGLVFFFVEKIRPAEKNVRFFKDDFKEELSFAFINVIITVPIFAALIYFILKYVVEPLIPYQMFAPQIEQLPILAQVILGAFILDLSTYWRHRFTHHYMWRFHSIHHSAEHLNWLTSMRLHPIDILIAVTFDLTILHFLGFSGAGMAFAVILLKGFNYFTHANIDLQFSRPMRYIFASPNFHRWHHANDISAYNKNFCSMFSCIDLMFGTYHHPEKVLPESYGLGGKDQENYQKNFLAQLAYPFKKPKK